MDFKLQMGRLLAILGIYLSIFSMWPSMGIPMCIPMCITMGHLFHVWGGVGVGLFLLFCDKYLY